MTALAHLGHLWETMQFCRLHIFVLILRLWQVRTCFKPYLMTCLVHSKKQNSCFMLHKYDISHYVYFVWKNIISDSNSRVGITLSVKLIKIFYHFKPLFNLKQKIPEITKCVGEEELKMKINMHLSDVIRALICQKSNYTWTEIVIFSSSFSWHPYLYLSLKGKSDGYKLSWSPCVGHEYTVETLLSPALWTSQNLILRKD